MCPPSTESPQKTLEPQVFQIRGGLLVRQGCHCSDLVTTQALLLSPCAPMRKSPVSSVCGSPLPPPLHPKGNVTYLMMCPKPPKYQPGEGWVTFS